MSFPSAPLSIGIIGAGQVVANLHLPTLLALVGARVAWVADAGAARARTLARAFTVEALAIPPDLGDLPVTDALLLAIPYGARPPYYRALGGRATSLYVEKPFARSLDEHQSICSAFPQAQVSIGLQRRSSGTIRLLREVLREKLFGPLRSVKVGHGLRGRVMGGTSYSANLALAGGGILFEVGIHLVDAALFATDAESFRIESGRMIRDGGFDLHTEALITLRLPGGEEVPAQILVSGLTDTIQGIECSFDHATVLVEAQGKALQVRPRSGGVSREFREALAGSCVTPFQISHAHWRGFLQSIADRKPNWTSASEAILTTRLIEGLYALGEN